MLRPARPRRPDRADRYDTKKTTMHHDAPADAIQTQGVRGAPVLILCAALEPNLAFWTERLGFRIEAIFPADDPTTAMISGHGLQLRLQQGPDGAVQTIYLLCDDALLTGAGQTTLTAPSGVVVKLVDANPPMHTPTTVQKLVLTRATGNDTWGLGRAGLRYRDLLPGRHGGAFIASHIRVLDGGPVPDYVHFHKIRFQTIFCRKGWVRVLYQGQGEPFVMHEGDCVLQPPMIRHRVLESSAGAEVVEVSAPAEHITMADHSLVLPGPDLPPGHDFAGQRFVRHVAATAAWLPWRAAGFEVRDTGIGPATDGLAGVRVVRPVGQGAQTQQAHDAELCFYFVLGGRVTVQCGKLSETLGPDDCITIPGGTAYGLGQCSADLQLLEVTLPAEVAPQI